MKNVVVIIPALNEEETISEVILRLQQQGVETICVVDNGSSDHTSHIAQQAGAHVVHEPRKGYGQACWTGLQTPMATQAEWILFCDGDGSDDLSELGKLLALRGQYDFILGNRRGTQQGKSQLTPVQNFGNWLATRLIRWGWGHAYEDLGPLRLIRKSSLDSLNMADRGFGWTVEMQAKAAGHGLKICERPVNYLPRQGGQSKISGTLQGSVKAGEVILTTLARLYCQQLQRQQLQHQQQYQTCLQSAAVQKSLLWISAVLIVVGSLLAMPHGDFLNEPNAVPLFWRGAGLMGLGFVAAWGLNKITGSWFWGVAIAARIILLAMHPSDDIWRYLWEGHIQTAGFNPYLLAPDAAVLEPLRFSWWEHINHLDHAAIYPPVTQLGFRILSALSPSVLFFKLSFTAADVALCWLLSRRFGYQQTLLYAWNPLILVSFAGGGHYDSWFLLPLVAAWLWWDSPQPAGKRPARKLLKSALATGISIALKWMSLPVLLFLAWRGTTQSYRPQKQTNLLIGLGVLIIGLLPLAIASLPFCQGLSCPVLPLNSTFVTVGRSAAFIPNVIVTENWVYALPLGGVILWNLARTQQISTFTERYFIALMLLSPIIHAWYFTWLTPFAASSRSWGTRLVSLSAFVYFALPHGLALGEQSWTLSNLQHSILWAPFILGIGVDTAMPKRLLDR